MALRDKKFFRAVGYALAGTTMLAFAVYLVLKVKAGQSADTYHSGTMIRWSYGAALGAFGAFALAAAAAWLIRFASWFRFQRELKRVANTRGSAGSIQGSLGSSSPNTSCMDSPGK